MNVSRDAHTAIRAEPSEVVVVLSDHLVHGLIECVVVGRLTREAKKLRFGLRLPNESDLDHDAADLADPLHEPESPIRPGGDPGRSCPVRRGRVHCHHPCGRHPPDLVPGKAHAGSDPTDLNTEPGVPIREPKRPVRTWHARRDAEEGWPTKWQGQVQLRVDDGSILATFGVWPFEVRLPPPRTGLSPFTCLSTRRVKCMSMYRTSVYLPEDLKADLAQVAAETGRREADLIREGIRLALAQHQPPTPTLPILVSSDPHFAENVDENLRGFGER